MRLFTDTTIIKGVYKMKYWIIDYYRTRNLIDTKYIKDKCAQGAIKKARVKHIIDVQETTEEDYLTYIERKVLLR